VEEFHNAPDVAIHAEAKAVGDVSGGCCHSVF
jgi:hypothetical protein